jgi:hypothetical protein
MKEAVDMDVLKDGHDVRLAHVTARQRAAP